MICYRIKDWGETFENATTRKLKRLTWLPVPIELTSNGYTMLMEMNDGPAIYGAWIAIVCVAGMGPPEMRGQLIKSNGTPYDAVSIARIVRMDVVVIEKALKVLSDPTIGWLEVVGNESRNVVPEAPATIATNVPVEPRSEKKAKPPAPSQPKLHPNKFEELWRGWPTVRKRSKQAARKAWDLACTKADPDVILEAARRYASSPDGQGKYSQMPSSWLNQERWDDDLDSWFRDDDSGSDESAELSDFIDTLGIQ